MPCPNKKSLRAYATEEEYAAIAAQAARANLTISRFLTVMALNGQVTGAEYLNVKVELAKLRADLGRLGGLLKLALSQRRGPIINKELRQGLAQVQAQQLKIDVVLARL